LEQYFHKATEINFCNALESTFSVRDGLSDLGERDPSRAKAGGEDGRQQGDNLWPEETRRAPSPRTCSLTAPALPPSHLSLPHQESPISKNMLFDREETRSPKIVKF